MQHHWKTPCAHKVICHYHPVQLHRNNRSVYFSWEPFEDSYEFAAFFSKHFIWSFKQCSSHTASSHPRLFSFSLPPFFSLMQTGLKTCTGACKHRHLLAQFTYSSCTYVSIEICLCWTSFSLLSYIKQSTVKVDFRPGDMCTSPCFWPKFFPDLIQWCIPDSEILYLPLVDCFCFCKVWQRSRFSFYHFLISWLTAIKQKKWGSPVSSFPPLLFVLFCILHINHLQVRVTGCKHEHMCWTVHQRVHVSILLMQWCALNHCCTCKYFWNPFLILCSCLLGKELGFTFVGVWWMGIFHSGFTCSLSLAVFSFRFEKMTFSLNQNSDFLLCI